MPQRSQPLVTIGLPVYNASKFLPDTLRSILAQTVSDWELVVADDGSTDRGIDLLRAVRDPRIRILESDGKRRGLAVRLNQIARAAHGHYVARMDADDLIHPQRIEAQVAFLHANPDVDVVGCGLLMIDESMNPVAEILNPAAHDTICADAVRGVRLAHATMFGRAEWFRAHPYEERNFRCEDWRLLYTSRSNSRFANLLDLLYFYRVFESFSMHKYAAHKLRNIKLWSELPRSECGWGRLAQLTARSVVDMAIYGSARMIGRHDKLIALRGSRVSRETVEEFAVALEMIRSIAVPAAPAGKSELDAVRR